MTLPPAPRHHQTIARSRDAAWHEKYKARSAYLQAIIHGASPARLARLKAAMSDADRLHHVWVRADALHLAALAEFAGAAD